ncbi:MAG TPA: hypothetical protein VJU61_13240 [Polyangiaceae bacterium]|nr:hypothetical protein [Polyangiaceae bacterium]
MNAVELGTLEEGQISWQVAHEALSRLARARAAADAEEGRWLLAAERAAVHVHLGYGSFSEYIERLFGYQPRSVQERLRVAEALEGLPSLARALSNGELSWSAARELTRVAVQDTEQEWLEFARGKTLRQLEQVLAYKSSGDTPASPPDLSAQRHTLRFDVAAETLALFREAMNELRRRADTHLDDDSALLELARRVLGGPSQEGRSSYQIVLSVCPDCGNGQQQSAGGLVPVGADIVSMAQCDAQHVSLRADPVATPSAAPANDLAPDAEREVRASTADSAMASDPVWAGQDGAHVSADARPSTSSVDNRNAHVGAPATSARRGSISVDNHAAQVDASATQGGPHVGANARRNSDSVESHTAQVDSSATPERAGAERAPANSSSQKNGAPSSGHALPRAKQTIPPALRRAVLLRDQHRCQVPGCCNSRWIDVHHIELRSEGGRHSLQNLICICGAHHHAAHHGQLRLERSESGVLCVRHADGSEYGRSVNPRRLELRTKVFSALRQLGFREGQVRAALEQLPSEPAGGQVCFDGMLRAALARLRSPAPGARHFFREA